MAERSLSRPLAGSLGYQVRRASVRIMGDLAKLLGSLNLTVVEASVLVLIDANPGVAQSDLGRELEIKSGNLAPIVLKLEARGLVRRVWIDGRSQALTLTPEGAVDAAAALQRFEAHEAECIGRAGEGSRAMLLAALARITETP